MAQGGGQALGLGEGFTGSGRLGLSVTEDGAEDVLRAPGDMVCHP